MKRFCTKCGNELVADTTFCDNCGTPIKDVTAAESTSTSGLSDARVNPDTKPRSGRDRRPLLIAGAATIAITIAIGGVWWGLGFRKLDKEKAATPKTSSGPAAKSDSSGSTSGGLPSVFSSDRPRYEGKWSNGKTGMDGMAFEIKKIGNAYTLDNRNLGTIVLKPIQDGVLEAGPFGTFVIDPKSDTLITNFGALHRVK